MSAPITCQRSKILSHSRFTSKARSQGPSTAVTIGSTRQTTIQVPCVCGKQVRLSVESLGRGPRCPQCKTPVPMWKCKIAWLRVALGRLGRAITRWLSLRSSVRPTQGIEQLLRDLARHAWQAKTEVSRGTFLLDESDLAQGSSPQALVDKLRKMYAHARQWAPGLEVPWKVPPVKLSFGIDSAGQFGVTDGWTAIDVSADFASRPRALHVILAHEACHHILDNSGLADRRNTARNERMTDLAMFICGFGDIVRAGRTATTQTKSGYVTTHLGYLTVSDYEYAFNWVIQARLDNSLPGMAGRLPTASVGPLHFNLTNPTEQLWSSLAARVPDPAVRERMYRYSCSKHPDETEEQVLRRIIDDFERDNR